MTSHGFGGGKLQSSKPPTRKQKDEFAKLLSEEVKHITRAYVVSSKTGRYDIMFEFDHLKKYCMTPKDLMKEIRKIKVHDHQMRSADFYIIQSCH